MCIWILQVKDTSFDALVPLSGYFRTHDVYLCQIWYTHAMHGSGLDYC